METDPTDMAIGEVRHPTLTELRNASHPSISEHLASCSMCRSVIAAEDEIETTLASSSRRSRACGLPSAASASAFSSSRSRSATPSTLSSTQNGHPTVALPSS